MLKYKTCRVLLFTLSIISAVHLQGQTPPPTTPPFRPQDNKPQSIETQVPFKIRIENAPNGYPAAGSLNYIRTRTGLAPIDNPNTFDNAGFHQVSQSTQYLDGLGRPLQTVFKQAGGGSTPKDIVAPVKYDAFGREAMKFLPYAQSQGEVGNGEFKYNPFVDQENFYTSVYKDANQNLMYAGENYLYGKTEFEASPLNRVKTSMAPGNSWTGSDKGVEQKYLVNTKSGDAVRIWTIGFATIPCSTSQTPDPNAPAYLPSSTETYENGKLYKNVSIDENGNAVVEYKDLEGKVVLKKVQIGKTDPSLTNYTGHADWLCTYYVYDDLGQLRFVIPPKAVEALNASTLPWDLSSRPTVINELCFRYEYDDRGRMISKKVPGAGWVYMVYDVRDRLVFTQDANMRKGNQWMTTYYDALNRPVMTGMMSGPQICRSELQGQLNDMSTFSLSNLSVSGTSASSGKLNIPYPIRDIGRRLYEAPESVIFEDGFVTEPGAELQARIVPVPGGSLGTTFVETTQDPIPQGFTFTALTMTHYDDYELAPGYYTDAFNSKVKVDEEENAYPETLLSNAAQSAVQTKGMVTWTKVRVLNPADLSQGVWLSTVMFYDDKGRVVQTRSENHKGGIDIMTNQYDFTGKVLCNYIVQNNLEAQGNQQVTTRTLMTYDHAGRVLEVTKTYNDDPKSTVSIERNTYDDMGQLRTKQLGKKRDEQTHAYTATPVETLDYNYNIRGWLKGINAAYSHPELSSTASNRWFGIELNYDWGSESSKNQLNGNISSTTWRSKGDGKRRSYGFTYDNANRILGADFAEHNGSIYDESSQLNFDVVMGNGIDHSSAYDQNGNIMSMTQYGKLQSPACPIDRLTYAYFDNTNKLKAVTDLADVAGTRSKLGDFTNDNTVGLDYGYDLNGNLVTDKNKKIDAGGLTDLDQATGGAIKYNHLNLPYEITVAGKGTITYTYDAAGNKLEKRVQEPANGATAAKDTKTSYLSGMIYENNVLQFVSHEDGRLRIKTDNNANAYNYDYFIKDHLGNVRMVLTDELKTDLYPAATLETASVTTEANFYSINTGQIEDVPAAVKNDHPSLQDKAYRLQNADGQKSGLGIALHVMAGDKVRFRAESYYNPPTGGNTAGNTGSVILSQLLGTFLNTSAVLGGKPGAAVGEITGNTSTVNALSTFLTDPTRNGGSAIPRASLNYILFDDNFNKTSVNFDPVTSAANGFTGHNKYASTPLTIDKNGYLYIYASNESDLKVLFDNLMVTHERGPLVEETHYYPFGLTMAGISSQAASSLVNKRKFNKGSELQNKEFSDGSGLELYATNLRSLDPQLGRWWQIDPKASESESPYASMSNNPIRFNDPLGDTIVDARIRGDKNWSKAYNTFLNSRAGKRFVKLYSPGGKFGKTTVEFKIGGTSNSGKTTAFSIDRKDGSATKLDPDKKYDAIDKIAKGESKNSYLKFEVNLRAGENMSNSVEHVEGGETILHETQHVNIDQQTLITDKAINNPFYQHRDWMKPTNSGYYQERAGFYIENRQMWQADYERQKAQGKVKSESNYIQRKVNDFFN